MALTRNEANNDATLTSPSQNVPCVLFGSRILVQSRNYRFEYREYFPNGRGARRHESRRCDDLEVITVGIDANIGEVATILLNDQISAVLLVAEKGELVGIVSEGDLMRRTKATPLAAELTPGVRAVVQPPGLRLAVMAQRS